MLDRDLRDLPVHDIGDEAARALRARMLRRHDARKRQLARAAVLVTACVTYLLWAIAFTLGR